MRLEVGKRLNQIDITNEQKLDEVLNLVPKESPERH